MCVVICRLNENMNLCSVIQKHLKPSPWMHLLKSFCNEDVNNLKFFIEKDLRVCFRIVFSILNQ